MSHELPEVPHERCAIRTAVMIRDACVRVGVDAVAPSATQRFAIAMAAYPVAGALVDSMQVEEAYMPDVPKLAASVLWASRLDPALSEAEQSERLGAYLDTARAVYAGIMFPRAGEASPSPQAREYLVLAGKCAAVFAATGDARGIEGLGQIIQLLAG